MAAVSTHKRFIHLTRGSWDRGEPRGRVHGDSTLNRGPAICIVQHSSVWNEPVIITTAIGSFLWWTVSLHSKINQHTLVVTDEPSKVGPETSSAKLIILSQQLSDFPCQVLRGGNLSFLPQWCLCHSEMRPSSCEQGYKELKRNNKSTFQSDPNYLLT